MYIEGDYVLVRNLQYKPGENAKLKPKCKDPYVIYKSLGNNRYVVHDIPGFNITSRHSTQFYLPIRSKNG